MARASVRLPDKLVMQLERLIPLARKLEGERASQEGRRPKNIDIATVIELGLPGLRELAGENNSASQPMTPEPDEDDGNDDDGDEHEPEIGRPHPGRQRRTRKVG